MSFAINREETLIELNGDNSEIPLNLSKKIDGTEDKNSKEITSKQFDDFLIESIDEALCLLGSSVKNEFYFRLEVNFNMEKKDIPQRLEEFSVILHRIFSLGASRLEVKFLKNLDTKIPFGSKCIVADWSVTTWIEKDMSFIKSIENKRQEFLKTE